MTATPRTPRALSEPGHFVDLGLFGAPFFTPRPVRAYLPAGLKPGAPHPTLYLFDGQNVFGDHGSYAGGWHAHEAVERMARTRAHKPVIVAVGNGGVQRNRELGPRVEAFLGLLATELVPRVEGALGGGPRILGGSSLGGLAALQGWMLYPEIFHGALVMSPSLWLGRRLLLRCLQQGGRCVPGQGKLYLDAGKRERGRMFADAELLAELLQSRGVGERLMWRPDARGAHHEKHWRRRLPKALRFLFAR